MGREATWGLWSTQRRPLGQEKAVTCIRDDRSQDAWTAASWLVLPSCHHMPPG